MVDRKKTIIKYSLLALLFLCLSIGIYCTLFIGGTSTIVTDTGNLINKFYNGTVIYAWVYESSGYAMLHQLKNFFLAFYFTTSNLKHLGKTTKTILHGYGTTVLKTLGWAALWEIVEKFFIFIVILLAYGYPDNVSIIYVYKYMGTGESVWNTILSDLPQSIIASTGVCILHYFMVITLLPSYILIEKKSIIVIILQFILVGLSGFAGFTISFKKSTSIGNIPIGYYAYFFLELFFISVLYIGDFYYLIPKSFPEQILIKDTEDEEQKIKELNQSYNILVFYVIIQWIGAFNLLAPGFITSNIAFVFFLLILLSFNNSIKK